MLSKPFSIFWRIISSSSGQRDGRQCAWSPRFRTGQMHQRADPASRSNWACIGAEVTAPGAPHTRPERRYGNVIGPRVDVDLGLVAAGAAGDEQPANAVLASERNRARDARSATPISRALYLYEGCGKNSS